MLGATIFGAALGHVGPIAARRIFGLKSQNNEPMPKLPPPMEGNIIVKKDLSYGPHPRQRYDAYLPPCRDGREVHGVVMLHGGGFVAGRRSDMDRFATVLAQRGIVALSACYRLLPRFGLGDILEDGRAMLACAHQSTEFQVQHWSVMGRSAGGYIAMMTAYSSELPVCSVISEAGPTDFSTYLWEGSIRGAAIRRACGDMSPEEISPVSIAHVKAPPTLLLHGALDPVVPVSQSRILEVYLRAIGVPVKLCVFPAVGHNPMSKRGSNDGIAWALHWIDTHKYR